VSSEDSASPRLQDLPGPLRRAASLLAIGLSLYSLYWVLFIVQPQIYRVSFLLIVLVLTFLLFPLRQGGRGGTRALDWLLMAAAIAALTWPIVDFGQFVYRAADPLPVDLVL
jgi:TRAP-type uncharacterized transport system fused permease subunit